MFHAEPSRQICPLARRGGLAVHRVPAIFPNKSVYSDHPLHGLDVTRHAAGQGYPLVLPIDVNKSISCHMATPTAALRNAHSVATEISDVETRAMLRAFFKLAERWGLNDRQGRILLGDPAARTYARWKVGQVEPSRISRDTRERQSILMGIHKSLRHMFPEPSRGYGWLRAPNRAFGGAPALVAGPCFQAVDRKPHQKSKEK